MRLTKIFDFYETEKNSQLHVQSVSIFTILISLKSAHKDAGKFNYKIHVPVKMRRKVEKMNFMRGRGEEMNYIWI